MKTDDDRTIEEFHGLVNMTPAALERWLATAESRAVGQKKGGATEATGHASGRRIVEILRKERASYDADDLGHMHEVVGYIKRHMAQKPTHPGGSRWEASLKNWGHDPAKKG